METVIENQTAEDNIFKSLENDSPTEYADLFGETDSDKLYYMFINLCGEKRVTNICKTLNNSELYKIIIAQYKDNWLRVKEAISGDYDVFNPFDVKEEVTENITANETIDKTDKNSSAVYAFNSGDIVDSDENITDKTGTVDNTHERTNTKVKSGNQGNITPAKLLKDEIKIRKTVYLEEILKDVMNYITLDVY